MGYCDYFGPVARWSQYPVSTVVRFEFQVFPPRSQIGGILASEMPVDEAGLHAAIIAVNEALDHEAEDNAARALRNPAACLADINQVHIYTLHPVWFHKGRM